MNSLRMVAQSQPLVETLFFLEDRSRIATDAIQRAILAASNSTAAPNQRAALLGKLIEKMSRQISAAYASPPSLLSGRRQASIDSGEPANATVVAFGMQVYHDAVVDTRALYRALLDAGEPAPASLRSAIETTAIWRSGLTFAIVCRCVVSWSGDEDKLRALQAAHSLARSAVRPGEWSDAPISLDRAYVLSAEVEACELKLVGLLKEGLSEHNAATRAERRSLQRRGVPQRLLRQLFEDGPTPTMVMCFASIR
jgi:hypothetical protein